MSPRDPHSRKCASRVGAPAPRPLMGVGFVRGVGPRTHAESVRVGHVWERGPICTACATRVPSAPSLLVAHGSFVSGAHPGCPGGNLPLLSAWRWPTEGAQGVLSCPLGITELSEPVSVDIYLHPIYIHLRKQLLYTLATLLRCSVVAQLRQCTGARGERVIGDVVT